MELINQRKINKNELNNILLDFSKSPFTTDNVVTELKKIKSLKEYRYKCELVKGTIFHFITNDEIKKIVDAYYFVLKLKQEINPGKFLKNCYIYVLPISINKRLTRIVSPDEINSGATNCYFGICGGPIYVWRKEEMIKVLVHETLHSLLYDQSIYQQKYKIFNNIKSLNLNEVYNEFGTIYVMSLMKGDVNKYLKKQLIHDEKNVKQIMKLQNLKTIADFKNFKQNASIFSYVVLKYLLLKYLIENKKNIHLLWKTGFFKINSNYQNLLKHIFNYYSTVKQVDLLEHKRNKQEFRFSIF